MTYKTNATRQERESKMKQLQPVTSVYLNLHVTTKKRVIFKHVLMNKIDGLVFYSDKQLLAFFEKYKARNKYKRYLYVNVNTQSNLTIMQSLTVKESPK